MAAIGQRNSLRVVRQAPPGLYLDGGTLGEILLPRRYIPEATAPGDVLDVFVYRDSEDRLVATTESPRAVVGGFAGLKVVSVHPRVGAFLDWGLSKDLLLPIREQTRRARVGDVVVAYVFLDEKSGRVVATTRLDRHLDRTGPAYTERQRVRLLVAAETPLGYRTIIENAHWGLLYKSDLGAPLKIGEELTGFVRAVRPDGKIDLGLDLTGYGRVAPLTQKILDALKAHGGHLPFGDRSAPAEIRKTFGASKKAFKQALGSLLRQRRIQITDDGIDLSPPAARA
jgi:predicted RNA-binding protein (virulence factor B family)